MSTSRVAVLALALACVLTGTRAARADSWMPYGGGITPDPTGRRYVVLRPVNSGLGGAEYMLVEAAPGSPDVTATKQKNPFEAAGPELAPRPGDRVVRRGTLKDAPIEVRVSSAGRGFAAMEEYGHVGGGESFVWIGADGKTHVRTLGDLFTKDEILTFTHTVSSIWWFRAAWVDDEAKEVVVVGNGGIVRTVSMDGGAVRPGLPTHLLRAAASRDPDAQLPAIDLLAESRAAGVDETLAKVLADPAATSSGRLHAAGSLARRGDPRGKDVLVRAAATPPPQDATKHDHEYALEHLAFAVGLEAVPALQAAMRVAPPNAWRSAMTGFVALGSKATPALTTMLTAAGDSDDYRGGAAHALGRIQDPAAIPALLAAVKDPKNYVANAAINAVIATGGASISKDLAALLDAKTTQDGRLASYFADVKEPASVGPMVRALRRQPKGGYERDVMRVALAFQTGALTAAATAEDWEAWFAKQTKYR